MILDRFIGGERPSDTPSRIGAAIGDVVGIAVWIVMIWVVLKAF